ncbi:MAG: hypothetical protein N3C13_04970 [Aquificaceae bacterium]|nr:hypothetical protein [Aquificaceae bacterium]MCX8060531.1 hypothetical protein [Aquificaceae bacterium]MDW8097385.1 hypothetical protein [Aquificaceae bacterium]
MLFFLTFPKFLFVDRKLSQAGLYLLADRVEEGLTGLSLTKVRLYDQQSKLATFDKLEISLRFLKIMVVGLCEGKSLRAELYPWSMSLNTESFTCLSGTDSLSANLSVRKGLYGKMSMKGLKFQDTKIDELSLELRGRVFRAKVKMMGFELVGDGQLVFKPSDPLRSGINGQVSGGGMKLVLSGTLERPQLLR